VALGLGLSLGLVLGLGLALGLALGLGLGLGLGIVFGLGANHDRPPVSFVASVLALVCVLVSVSVLALE